MSLLTTAAGFDNAMGYSFLFPGASGPGSLVAPLGCVWGRAACPEEPGLLSSSPRQLDVDQQLPSHPGSLPQHVVPLHGVTDWEPGFPVVIA